MDFAILPKLNAKLRIKTLFILLVLSISCNAKQESNKILPGANQSQQYFPLLKNNNLGCVVNHTSIIENVHLVDSLISEKINITAIFSPEHGFRGDADRGALIDNSIDAKTGIPIVSLHGQHRKPQISDLKNIDVMLFDIQDVGVRFYTYISTMYLVMQACAENDIPLFVLDRPNPNGDYIAGPVLDTANYRSFVGMLPIPIVYGLTMGELAKMINGEGWLGENLVCDLTVIKCKNYTHASKYELPVKPSPNLPNFRSIRLYPSLCFFEATSVSIGRGTKFPFQVIGYPDSTYGDFSFTPVSIPGASTNPLHENKTCFGEDLRNGNDYNHFSYEPFLRWYSKLSLIHI